MATLYWNNKDACLLIEINGEYERTGCWKSKSFPFQIELTEDGIYLCPWTLPPGVGDTHDVYYGEGWGDFPTMMEKRFGPLFGLDRATCCFSGSAAGKTYEFSGRSRFGGGIIPSGASPEVTHPCEGEDFLSLLGSLGLELGGEIFPTEHGIANPTTPGYGLSIPEIVDFCHYTCVFFFGKHYMPLIPFTKITAEMLSEIFSKDEERAIDLLPEKKDELIANGFPEEAERLTIEDVRDYPLSWRTFCQENASGYFIVFPDGTGDFSAYGLGEPRIKVTPAVFLGVGEKNEEDNEPSVRLIPPSCSSVVYGASAYDFSLKSSLFAGSEGWGGVEEEGENSLGCLGRSIFEAFFSVGVPSEVFLQRLENFPLIASFFTRYNLPVLGRYNPYSEDMSLRISGSFDPSEVQWVKLYFRGFGGDDGMGEGGDGNKEDNCDGGSSEITETRFNEDNGCLEIKMIVPQDNPPSWWEMYYPGVPYPPNEDNEAAWSDYQNYLFDVGEVVSGERPFSYRESIVIDEDVFGLGYFWPVDVVMSWPYAGDIYHEPREYSEIFVRPYLRLPDGQGRPQLFDGGENHICYLHYLFGLFFGVCRVELCLKAGANATWVESDSEVLSAPNSGESVFSFSYLPVEYEEAMLSQFGDVLPLVDPRYYGVDPEDYLGAAALDGPSLFPVLPPSCFSLGIDEDFVESSCPAVVREGSDIEDAFLLVLTPKGRVFLDRLARAVCDFHDIERPSLWGSAFFRGDFNIEDVQGVKICYKFFLDTEPLNPALKAFWQNLKNCIEY